MDLEVIDLTEESKADLNDDQRYIRLEDSIMIEDSVVIEEAMRIESEMVDYNLKDDLICDLNDYDYDNEIMSNRNLDIDDDQSIEKMNQESDIESVHEDPISPVQFTGLKRNLVDTSFNQEIVFDDVPVKSFDLKKNKQKKRIKLTEEEKLERTKDKQREKERKQNERKELNRQKEKLKEKQKKLKEANRYLNLRNASQYCTTIVSQTLIDRFLNSDDLLNKLFEENELNLEIDRFAIDKLPTVKWKRILHTRNDTIIADKSVLNLSEILSKEEIEEDHLILVLNNEQFAKMVYKFVLSTNEQPEEIFEFDETDQENISLLAYINRLIERHKKSIIFIVYNLEAYFRKLKNREHRDFLQMMNEDQQRKKATNARQSKIPLITRINVDEAILNTNLELMKNDTVVELKLKIKFQFADNQTELINMIYNLSNSMADAPYKRWRNAQEGFDWFVDGDSKTGSVNVKELPCDVTKLWLKHLLLFDKVSLPVAKSIVQKYPNIMALKSQYDSLTNIRDKELLLTKIVLKENNRTINPDISKRIYKFITETNEDEMLA